MTTIKEKRIAIEADRGTFVKEVYIPYIRNVYIPAIISLTEECETAGHVNMETITRDDGSQYYICDNCKKQIELN